MAVLHRIGLGWMVLFSGGDEGSVCHVVRCTIQWPWTCPARQTSCHDLQRGIRQRMFNGFMRDRVWVFGENKMASDLNWIMDFLQSLV